MILGMESEEERKRRRQATWEGGVSSAASLDVRFFANANAAQKLMAAFAIAREGAPKEDHDASSRPSRSVGGVRKSQR